MINVPFSPPDINEEDIAAVSAVLRSGWVTTGPQAKMFEQEIAGACGTDRAVVLNSATAALELTLRVLGVGPGDDVITTAYTYTATASVIHHVGARIVLVDIAADGYGIDADAVARAITPSTKAVIGVDVGGVVSDYDRLRSVAESARRSFLPKGRVQEVLGRIAIIADGAHSFGATRRGQTSGAVADFTSFSFHAVKNLITAEGGAVTWRADLGLDNEALYRDFMLLSLHGQSKDAFAKARNGGWEYDVELPGYKANMTDIMAALGRSQLRRYPEMLERRRAVALSYDSGFADLDVAPLPHSTADGESSLHLYMIDLAGRGVEQRNELISLLAERGVSSNVHYKPLPTLTAYRRMGFDIADFPKAHERYSNEVTLPLFSAMADEQVDHVIESFRNAINQIS
ncbi:DegT/DnrJ/EryC1/StrS family aminotransferase [Agromyces italicus]|uniref:DegT/DnrJ/EryC1/StrS family aminotransferase n=1 Tax=Agromyces italicus TaxID=279572 RepID=UPI0012FA505B|nr:DegT/DnrJ/EryC1/StrS aminotransferase family protein [Agromyces italicus]